MRMEAVRREGWFARLMVLCWLAFAGAAFAQPAPAEHHIAVSLVAESAVPAAGRTVTLAISMRPQPGWHGYWRHPGDAGLAPKLTWTLPPMVTAGEPAYPTPRALLVSGLMNHVYDKPYAMLVPVTLPAGLAAGTSLPIDLAMQYLVCTEQLCVPEKSAVSARLTVGDGTLDPLAATEFAQWRRALPRVAPGPATFAIDHGVLRVQVPLPPGVRPETPHLFVDADNLVDFAASQRFSLNAGALIVETKAAAGAVARGPAKAVLDLGPSGGIDVAALPGAVAATGAPLDGAVNSGAAPSGGSMLRLTLVAFAGAVLGGLILNVMPCVFPILSLKALSLARSNAAPAEARAEALAYSGGVIAVCVALGLLILGLRAAGDQVGWAFQLQKPGVIFGLILLVTAIGFNLAGLFELASVNAGAELTTKRGAAGAFWTGALAAFVATPCTGPFMAAALGAALVLPFAAALLIFAGLGLGLSLPFLAIGFLPRVRRSLPKPGPWMNTFRHVLAVPMFVTALGLAWVIGNETGSLGIIVSLAAALIFALGLWSVGLRQRAMKERAWVPALIAAAIAVPLALMLPQSSTGKTEQVARRGVEAFDPARLAVLRAEHKPVFLYLTADWCLSCKVNEKVAIERGETQAAFAEAGVITMIGDWTSGNARITQFLNEHQRSGVPIYLWYGAEDQPKVLPQILTTGLLISLAQESGRKIGPN